MPLTPPHDKWTIEDFNPLADTPPDGHHDQPDEDPPDLPPET